ILQEKVHVFGQTQDMLQAPTRQQPEPGHSTLSTAHLPEATSRWAAEEMENYHRAMNKMAEDILALRRQVSTLNSDNSQLRSRFSLHHDLSRSPLNTDIDVMTKEEIADCIASLKFKLVSERDQSAVQRDKIQQLQNELIRKNDCEKMLQQLQRAHQQQQTVMQQYQGRLARMVDLEATVRQQEKVLHAPWTVPSLSCLSTGIHSLIVQSDNALSMQALCSLEENSQKWGREKEELLTRLSEHSHGFAHKATTLRDSLLVSVVSHPWNF
uniref:Coiled-coil domain containing 33 n=1 Tax=Paramormyrops kingsleyae TaxID=1676925 RepID=A0A3B3SWJ3_9TELE